MPARMRFVAALAVTTGASDRATGGVGGVAEGGGATRWAATRSAGQLRVERRRRGRSVSSPSRWPEMRSNVTGVPDG